MLIGECDNKNTLSMLRNLLLCVDNFVKYGVIKVDEAPLNNIPRTPFIMRLEVLYVLEQ